jgi:hypothetical protein
MPLPIPLRSDAARERQAQAERRLLAGLCQGSLSQQIREDVQRRLAARKFADPEHDVIFQALSTLPNGEPERIRVALLTRLTRLGFPDLDLESLFTIVPPSETEIPALLELLA